jgi:hypothetical protein
MIRQEMSVGVAHQTRECLPCRIGNRGLPLTEVIDNAQRAHPGSLGFRLSWNKKKARAAAKAFAALFGAKFPNAAAKITDDLDQLLAFYDYPAEHWMHLRTTNPIESTFAMVRLRTAPGRARPRRSHLQRREARGTARRASTGSRHHITHRDR